MTQPANSERLKISMDLSESALEEALKQCGYGAENYCLKSERPNAWGVLKIASQQMGLAPFIKDRVFTKLQAITLDIDSSYLPDEWSITVIDYSGEPKQSCVWSPGA